MLISSKISYIEFYVFNAFQAANFYRSVLGFDIIGYGGPETGLQDKISYILVQEEIKIIISSSVSTNSPLSQHIFLHNDSVKDIAFLCKNVKKAFEFCIKSGAIPFLEPTEINDNKEKIIKASVCTFGDTIHSFIEQNSDSNILPFYTPISQQCQYSRFGLKKIDHIAIALESGTLKHWQEFYEKVFNFHIFYSENIYLGKSGMLSVVMANKEENIKFVLIEPFSDGETSQIETFLNYNRGAGVQHLAFLSEDIINSVTLLKEQGISFLDIPVDYYTELKEDIKQKLNNIESIKKNQILVDQEKNGYLMQVFSKPIQSSPTFFIELIQREKATGFGSKNIKALYTAVQKAQKLLKLVK
jgi:4-hydroxyphenylpyruvate dioxygenase